MKVYAYSPIHYGAEYLDASIRSYADLVEKIIILYSPKASYGTRSGTCPETENQLKEIAFNASNKVVWKHVSEKSEGGHRGVHKQYFNECDIMFTSDADEVWWDDKLEATIKEAYDDKEFSHFGVNGKVDLWRSFDNQMIDWFAPVRILKNKGKGQRNIDCPYLHFGYAQSWEIIEYKMSIHGHIGEVRKLYGSVQNYLNVIKGWNVESDGKFHPASRDIWKKSQPYDKSLMPDLMKDHKYYNTENIW